MADTATEPVVKDPISAWLDADAAEIDKRIEKIDPGAPKVSEVPMDFGKPGAPEKPAEPVVVEPIVEPPTEAPPVEEPPAEEAEEAAEAKARGTRPRWKDVREADKRTREQERRNAELEQQIAYLQGLSARVEPPPPAAEQPPEETPDPIQTLENKQARLEAELAYLRNNTAVQAAETRIVNEERAFEVSNPNYKEALTHLVESERRFAEVSGELDAGAAFLHRNLREPIRIGENVYPPGWIAAVSERTGKPIGETAKEIAFAIYIEGRRTRLIASARAAGKPVPQAVMEAAGVYGFSPKSATPAVSTTPAPARLDPAALKEASASLSNVPNSGASPQARTIKTHEELRQIFATLSPKERGDFIDRNDARDPAWLEKLG